MRLTDSSRGGALGRSGSRGAGAILGNRAIAASRSASRRAFCFSSVASIISASDGGNFWRCASVINPSRTSAVSYGVSSAAQAFIVGLGRVSRHNVSTANKAPTASLISTANLLFIQLFEHLESVALPLRYLV